MRSRTLARILYGGRSGDYGLLAIAGAVPLATAWWAHVFWTAGRYKGYGQSQWIVWPLLLPLVLWIVRALSRRIVPEDPKRAGVVALFTSRASPAGALEAHTITHGSLLTALALALLISLLDARDVLSCYVDAGHQPREFDWSVMFLTGVAAKWPNLIHVGAAYAVQGLGILLGVLLVVLSARHNLFFVASIYQRRRRQDVDQSIVVDFDDVNERFGFEAADTAFNAQVRMLILAGPVFLITRIPNAQLPEDRLGELSAAIGGLATLKVGNFVGVVSTLPLFPDIGQKVLLGAWLATLAIVTLPAIVKFLPVLRRQPRWDVVVFLREFLPTTSSVLAATPPANDDVRDLARTFARHSVWPAGDGQARLLFFAAFFVLGWIVIPLPLTVRWDVMATFFVSLGVGAGAGVAGVLITLRYLLAAVSPLLVRSKDG